MPSWPSIPPADGKLPAIRIVRTPATASLRFTVFSRSVTGAMTHYAGNRTQLCTGPDCPECQLHHLPRWYGYLATYDPRTHARRLFEFPQGPYNEIRDYLKNFRDLLGARFKVYRQPARVNGPVQLDISPPDETIKQYPPEVDVFRLLCQIWKLRYTDYLEDYNNSNLENADGISPQTNKHPDPPDKPHSPKDIIEQHTRGLNLDHLLPPQTDNGSN